MYYICKIWKNLLIMPLFLLLSQCRIKFGPNVAWKTPPILFLLNNFYLNMFEKSINSNKLCCYVLVLKKFGKTFNNSYFGPFLGKKRARMGHAQNDNQIFFSWNNIRRSWAFRYFLFQQNIISFDWVMNDFLV